jgi:hypothetical protein
MSWGKVGAIAADPGGEATGGRYGRSNVWNTTSNPGRAATGGKYARGKEFDSVRGELEKATGLDEKDIAGQFNPADFFNQLKDPRQSSFRGHQKALTTMLMGQANGTAPSLTNANIAMDRTAGMNNISAQTASARGVNNAFAARGGQQAASNLAGQLAQQRVAGNIQERQIAQQNLGQHLASARTQDMDFEKMRIGQSNLKMDALMQEALQRQKLNAEGSMATRGNRYNNWVQQQESGRTMLGGMGGMMAMSDERSKENIQEISKEDVSEFLSAIKPKTFEYKDATQEGTAEGERIGFVLQDVEHTKLGKKLIRRNKDGFLMYDKDNLNGIILAALAHK